MAFHMKKGIGPQGLGAPKSVAKQVTDTKVKDLPKVISNKAEEVKDKVVEGGKKIIKKIGNITIASKERKACKKVGGIYKKGKCYKPKAAAKKAKPDFLDLDKDGNTTEPMKSAAKQKIKNKQTGKPFHATAKGKKIGKELKSGRSPGEKPKG